MDHANSSKDPAGATTPNHAAGAEVEAELTALARRMRRRVLNMVHRAGSSHVGTCFSMADLLAVLYGRILRVEPSRPDWPERDRFILSKGHGCAALYAALAERGFFPFDWLESFYHDGARLAGHATHTSAPGVEVSTGSLGHGLSLACGMALIALREHNPARIFAMLSDGECDEGSTWEAALFAPHHKLDNLTAIIDYNKIQSLGSVSETLELEPFADKWRAFGWSVREIDGHNVGEILRALGQLPASARQPTCIIAHTVKGKGVSFMENRLLWHYRSPDPDEFQRAMQELEAK
ncbi:MAG TPA: transketolase [Candidatus Binataceae bacterium]|nr:transketolase [Candidatus Binataceae bacterium]